MRNKHLGGLTAGGCIGLALMLLVLPLKWLFGAAVAATVHELFHFFAIRLCSGKDAKLRVGFFGAAMKMPEMGRGKEMFCALAGPLGGLLLLLLARWFPRVAVCGVLQSFYNLLPIYPLDGGRALRCGVSMAFSPRWAERVCNGIEGICFLGIAAVGLYGAFVLKLGFLPLLPALTVLMKTKVRKSTCKPKLLRVQ